MLATSQIIRKALILMVFIFISCENKWEITKINEFILDRTLDSTKYKTFDELTFNSDIYKIILSETRQNIFLKNARIYKEKYIFIEKEFKLDNGKIVLLKYNINGKLIDSLIISRSCEIINDYIFYKNSYCSWFIDQDKKFKNYKNFDNFLKSDTTKVKLIAGKIKKGNKLYYSKSEFYTSLIDTCNFIMLFNNHKIEKYNFLSSVKPIDYLQSKSNIKEGLSDNFKELDCLNSDILFDYDNFYIRYKSKLIREGINGNKLFNNTGSTSSIKSYYTGTYFITLKNQNKLKIKIMNYDLNEQEEYKFSIDARLYSSDLINFYLVEIEDNCYLIKK